ncbi:MAG TPA: hypothetical protein VLL76_05155 [Candidatus Omnitrophota bacterium]|nr:hypothetical protein [Candidatus Omnitrophota bacterium]
MDNSAIDWRDHPVVYRINAADVIVYVNDAWRDFARHNGDADLADRAIGQSLWALITDPTLVRLYRDLVAAVRQSRRVLSFSYRCDSPDEKRELVMTIRPLLDEVEFENRFVAIEPQSPRAFFDRFVRGDRQAVSICSICQKLAADDHWLDPIEAFHSGAVHLDDTPLVLSPTVCPACEGDLEALAGGAVGPKLPRHP